METDLPTGIKLVELIHRSYPVLHDPQGYYSMSITEIIVLWINVVAVGEGARNKVIDWRVMKGVVPYTFYDRNHTPAVSVVASYGEEYWQEPQALPGEVRLAMDRMQFGWLIDGVDQP